MGGGWEGWLCGCSKDFDRGDFFLGGWIRWRLSRRSVWRFVCLLIKRNLSLNLIKNFFLTC